VSLDPGTTRSGAASEGAADASDTGLFVYGVVPSEHGTTPELRGLDESPVRPVSCGRVAAMVGSIAIDRPPGRRREIVAYSTVLDTLAESLPVVPVRFGSVMLDEDSVVEELLAPNEDYFAELLDELSGRTQVTVRASYLEHVVLAEVVASDPEIEDLRARTRDAPEDSMYGERVRLGELVSAALEHKRQGDAPVLLDPLLPYAAAYVVHDRGGLDHLLEVALLVDRERLPELEHLLEDLAEAVHERIRVQLMGPTAAYDFVGDN
jgi:hypothetical protein